MATLFTKIINGEIPSDKVYEDNRVSAFKDINPIAPVHILIVPRKEIPTVNDIGEADKELVGHMFQVAAQIAADQGIAESGYRLLINCNADGGQEIFHLHMHLLGGRNLGPMLA
jgi:histidine triad (HIT) family protein